MNFKYIIRHYLLEKPCVHEIPRTYPSYTDSGVSCVTVLSVEPQSQVSQAKSLLLPLALVSQDFSHFNSPILFEIISWRMFFRVPSNAINRNLFQLSGHVAFKNFSWDSLACAHGLARAAAPASSCTVPGAAVYTSPYYPRRCPPLRTTP